MLMRYLGSMVNVVASSLGLVTLMICTIAGMAWFTLPIVIGVYAISAFVAWFLLPSSPADREPPKVRPRRAA